MRRVMNSSTCAWVRARSGVCCSSIQMRKVTRPRRDALTCRSNSDIAGVVSAGAAQQHPPGVGAQHLVMLGWGLGDGLRRPGHQLPRGGRAVGQGTGVEEQRPQVDQRLARSRRVEHRAD